MSAPKNNLPTDLRAQIAERKADILALLRQRSLTQGIAAPSIKRRARSEPAPLSFAQERLWFLEQLEPESSVYNICRASCLLGNLNTSALEASLNEIISRHETLRTAFRLVDGRPVQVVQPIQNISIEYVDLRAIPDNERDAEIQRRIKADLDCAFDLSAGFLLRSTLLRAGDQENVLILMTHHAASDAWSMGILIRELWRLYQAFSNGNPSQLEPLPVQYSDYAVWQRDWLQGEVLKAQLLYWKEHLKNLPILNLPTDRPRKPRQSFHGARVTITLPEELTSALNEMSHRHGVTPFMTLLAGFQVLLYRYTGQEDVVVGSPVANRRRLELEGLIGFFVNSLVLRGDLSGNPSFRNLLLRTRDLCIAAGTNQDLPFEKLVQELQPERDQSRNPLFQVMFVLQNATRPFTGIPSLRIEPMEVTITRSPFDLSLFLRERAGKYTGHIEYSTDLFNRDRIERMAGHFRVLLEAVTSNPDQPITTLPILTEAERHQILLEWNDTATEFPRDKCIHHLFENQVERTPEAIAVEFENQQITYRELNRRANQLAHYLISLGIGPEKLVGVCIERSIEMVVGLLGILKAGGAYVPLDPAYPDERLRFMLEDSRVSVLLTQEKLVQDSGLRTLDSDLRSSILDSGFQVVYLDRDFALIAQQKKKNPCSRVGSTNLAYVIYTSGSTGQPKGVAIEHRNTCNLIYWAKSIYAPEELKGVLASTSICFDLSVFELFAPISWGGTIILVENVLALSQAADTGITLVNTVPSGMAAVLSAGRLPDSIRVINLAGEPLQSELVEQLHRTGSVEKIYDLYGPSETTTYSTFNRRNPGGAVTIGRAIANTQIYLLDPNHMPVPIGVTGEIYIGGAGVARGYFNHPDLTGENFITDPFNCDSNNRLYRTGDLGRYLPDANVQFLGRIDNQVKIRGYRIELGEIESALNQHPNVKESIVIASSFTPSRRKRIKVGVTLSMDGMREETPLSLPSPIEGERVSDPDRNLIAYLVSNAEKPLVTGLRRFLNQKLPDHMVPSLFIFLDTLPLGLNGKIDRSKLPPPDEARSGLANAAIPPRSELEELVGNIWRDVLQFENVSIYDNFFSLGGHSLLAIQIVSRLQEAFNKEVPLRILFDSPTIAELGQELATIIREGHAPKLPPIVRAPRDEPLPLSVNQEHLWYLDRVIPGTHFLNMPFVYHLNGDLNVEALTRALKEIVRRHEVLRTRFGELDGNPVQIIGDGSDFELMAIDLRGESAEGVSQEAADLIVGERQVPFDLALGPLIRTKLLRLTENDYLLLLTIHHIISDYWSVQIIRRELFTLYEAYSQGRPSPLPEPAVQFADYAMWERRMLKDQFFQPDLRFWTRKLGGPSTEEFDTDKLRSKPFAPIAAEHIHIDETLWSNLKSLAREENCTPASVISTVLGIVVGHCTAREDVMIAMLVANRANPIIEHTIGHFVNTIILRTRISRTITPRQALRDIRRQMVQAIIHQQYPFEDLVRSLKSQKTDYGKSLFQVLLSYQSFSAVTAQFSGLTFAPFHTADAEPTPTRFDMVCRLRETSTTLTGTVNWRVDAFCPNIGPEVSALSVHLLKSIVSFPEKPVSEALAEARFR